MAPILADMTDGDITSIGGSQTVRRQRDARRHSLEQLQGDGSPRTFVLEGDEMLIGRAPESHVRLSSKRASRLHALLRLRGHDCMLLDNDSHNGVFLNGVKIHSAVLRDGDMIQVADSIFLYSED